MSLDNYTTILYGWKFEGEDINNLQDELDEWNDDWFNNYQDVIVEDDMCNEYMYIGIILNKWDSMEYKSMNIPKNYQTIYNKKWNEFVKEHKEFLNIINKYINKEPQLYVFQHIW